MHKSGSRSVVSDSLRPHGLYSPWNSPGQNTGVGSLSLLQRDLPNPGIKLKSPTLWADSFFFFFLHHICECLLSQNNKKQKPESLL